MFEGLLGTEVDEAIMLFVFRGQAETKKWESQGYTFTPQISGNKSIFSNVIKKAASRCPCHSVHAGGSLYQVTSKRLFHS